MFFTISNSLTNVLQILKHYSNNSSVNLRRVVLIRCAYADSCSRSQRSETQAICAAMDPSSEEEAGSQQDEPRSKAATSADSSRWPISVEHSKPSECCLCASKSTDPNPLVQEVEEAADTLQWRPWAKYRKLPQHWVRVSEGKVCLPCFNVFRLLGKHKKYKKVLNYYQHISQKTNQAAQNEHKDFLAALKQCLKQHQEYPDKFKLKNKDDLLKTQRELVISKKQGGRLTAPKKQFVLSSHWDTARH